MPNHLQIISTCVEAAPPHTRQLLSYHTLGGSHFSDGFYPIVAVSGGLDFRVVQGADDLDGRDQMVIVDDSCHFEDDFLDYVHGQIETRPLYCLLHKGDASRCREHERQILQNLKHHHGQLFFSRDHHTEGSVLGDGLEAVAQGLLYPVPSTNQVIQAIATLKTALPYQNVLEDARFALVKRLNLLAAKIAQGKVNGQDSFDEEMRAIENAPVIEHINPFLEMLRQLEAVEEFIEQWEAIRPNLVK